MAMTSRERDPLLDRHVSEAIERRGVELLGLGLAGAGALLLAALASYSPADPGWLSASDAPIANWLGAAGASAASPLHVLFGRGSLVLALVPLAAGVRLALHRGEDRMLRRALWAPFALLAAVVHLATLPKGAGWAHDFGMGGIFGDTALGALLNAIPLPFAVGVPLVGILSLGALAFCGLKATGFDRGELRWLARTGAVSVILCYDQAVRLLARAGAGAARGTARAARVAVDGHAARREARAEAARRAAPAPEDAARGRGAAGEPVPGRAGVARRGWRASPDEADAHAAPEEGGAAPGLPGLPGSGPMDDEVIDDEPRLPPSGAAGGEDRLKARIGEAIKSRVRRPIVLEARPQPRLTARAAAAMPPSIPPAPEEEDAGAAAGGAGVPTFRHAGTAPAAEAPAPKPAARVRAAARPPSAPAPAAGGEGDAVETPPMDLLRDPATVTRHVLSEEALEENARMLESVLDDYGVKGEIVSVRPGPVVTMYELEPAPGLKASRVIGLADDIARSMSALAARVSTVPGRSVIGIELPNENREMCVLREILSARDYGDAQTRLPLALGKDIGGEPVVANLAKMPHLLIAGTTGSGKSVAINTMILSLLYRLTPEECRLIMIDPKMLELSVYDGIPHLLSPVVTDPKKAVVALKWVVGEMEDRYRKMSKMGVRNIEGYNGRVRETLARGEMFERTVQTGFDDETGDPVFETEVIEPKAMPYIVVVVDEMADLMMVAGKEIEACIQRLAQMARASGIHLIMATQRPSVDVITGTIKANFPTRISFQVTSKIDSRTILGEMGAEQLLGQGDMLYMAGGGKVTRIHGPFCSDEEVEEIVNFLKQFGPPDYVSGVQDGPEEAPAEGGGGTSIDEVLGLGNSGNAEDQLYDQAVQIAVKDRKASTSYIQRKLGIGYNKAARLVERMEDEGVVSASNHVGKREVLVPEPQ
ncbi:DNA translocase FtsK [Hasllibacter halocynthiae]|uniref:DNA translocase FtsK n=1 Tax=Hasllibacter halocynthiae TaxID=595589 RepID=A0A2T0X1H3_9RHOB|nr:DNA translocase FtsK 4TM domain-containing protein [Hasllibacter halocynthiae]PRY92767.1 DNA translocase FtsK [Hasllibacter halocynthiae]